MGKRSDEALVRRYRVRIERISAEMDTGDLSP